MRQCTSQRFGGLPRTVPDIGHSSIPAAPSAVTSLLYDFNKLTDPIKGATGPFVITSDGNEGCQWILLIIDQHGTFTVLSQTQLGCPAS